MIADGQGQIGESAQFHTSHDSGKDDDGYFLRNHGKKREARAWCGRGVSNLGLGARFLLRPSILGQPTALHRSILALSESETLLTGLRFKERGGRVPRVP